MSSTTARHLTSPPIPWWPASSGPWGRGAPRGYREDGPPPPAPAGGPPSHALQSPRGGHVNVPRWGPRNLDKLSPFPLLRQVHVFIGLQLYLEPNKQKFNCAQPRFSLVLVLFRI